jgi:hypothetical protein
MLRDVPRKSNILVRLRALSYELRHKGQLRGSGQPAREGRRNTSNTPRNHGPSS